MQLKSEVLERLLLSKAFLDRIRFQPVAVHDRHTLASNIVTAHDSAEFAIASICDQLNCLPQKGTSYLMNYLDSLKTSQHPGADVSARGYFRDLNDVRNLVKHQGLFPDGRQWARVGETVFQHTLNGCGTTCASRSLIWMSPCCCWMPVLNLCTTAPIRASTQESTNEHSNNVPVR
jgi:hypothetical protein